MYVSVFLLASYLNYRHKEALLLTLVVGLGAFLPIPTQYGALAWYSICAGIEFAIFLFGISLTTRASIPIALLSTLFILVHFLGWTFNGYLSNSPYHYFARTLEYVEILTCLILSNPVIEYLKERIK